MENLKLLMEKRGIQGTNNWLKKGELHQELKQKNKDEKDLLDKEREEKLIKKLKNFESYYSTKSINTEALVKKRQKCENKDLINANQPKTPEPQSPELYDLDDQEPKPPIDKQEVSQRLRQLTEVVTYFGESDWQRYKRLQEIELQILDKALGNEKPAGRENQIFEKITSEELKSRIQAQEESIQSFLSRLDKQQDEPIVNPQKHYQHRQAREFEMVLLKEGNYESKCDDVYVWCKNILKQWELKLMEKYDNETKKRSLEGSKAIGTYNQSVDYIKPLTEMLKKRKINEEILNSLYCIIRYCVLKEYVRAHDKYLELAIGNAPWRNQQKINQIKKAMGVTMVGIHERTGRAKIFSSQIAHILNDETQRKYIQSIKRLITFSQKFYPNPDPSKMVDFQCVITL